MKGKKVLHLDRNDFYGGECASLSLSKLFARFRPGQQYDTARYGRDRDYNIDIIPKFMMANGELVQILVHTDVTRYLEFQQIAGSFVYREGSGVCKVPSTELEALSSPLMGFFEKRRAKGFFEFVQRLSVTDRSTWQQRDLATMTMLQLYKDFSLEPGTQDFIGHSLGLQSNEDYLAHPALETCARIKLYMSSMMRFGKSPYVYPLYGLSELPQAFARLSAIYGGTYMLSQPVDEILYDEASGRVRGVRSGEMVATCDAIIADPSYVEAARVRLSHRVIRAICLLDHPIASTNNADSCQIIIPQRQLQRTHDVYIACVSSAHQVCAPGFYVAMISTIIESDQPEREIAFAKSLLGPILETFTWVSDLMEPTESGKQQGLYIARSYDASSHFESVCKDVKDLYERYCGEPLTVEKRQSAEEEQERLSRSVSASATDV